VRQELSKPLVEELASYMREQRSKLSRGHDLAKAIDYILKRWAAFTLFLDDGRVCLSNNGSCPMTWCRSEAPEQRWLRGQAATAGRMTMALSLTEPRVSRLM
jgi:hypothetical protein